MRFSIITPTIQRQSLIRCCQSVVNQTFDDWEMIIQVDSEKINEDLFSRISPTRKIWVEECGCWHNNGGNTCRNIAWRRATGEYLVHLDDDNWLADSRILQDISATLEEAGNPEWGLFPMLWHGQLFYTNPPHYAAVDTGNVVVKREIGRWPNVPQRESDWILIEGLMRHPYKAFPEFRPIIILPDSNFGKMEVA